MINLDFWPIKQDYIKPFDTKAKKQQHFWLKISILKNLYTA